MTDHGTLCCPGGQPTLAACCQRKQAGGHRRIQRGFSLLEILVAFAIAAMAIGMLYRVTGNNARQVANLSVHEQAIVLAQSLLAVHPAVPEIGLSLAGHDGRYSWTVQSQPYPTPVDSRVPDSPHLHEVWVDVQWQDNARRRSFQLGTLRPQRREEPDATSSDGVQE